MNIGICEDNKEYQSQILSMIHEYESIKEEIIIHVKTYSDAEDFLYDYLEGVPFDLLLLDINLPGKNGYELAKIIREHDTTIPICFVTNYDTYLYQGYEIGIYRYLKKPLKLEDLSPVLDYADTLSKSMNKKVLQFKMNGETIRLLVNRILYITSEGHHAIVFTEDGKKYDFLLKENFDALYKTLPDKYFIRCHRGFIVNSIYVSKFTHTELTLISNDQIPIGRQYKESTLEALHFFVFGD